MSLHSMLLNKMPFNGDKGDIRVFLWKPVMMETKTRTINLEYESFKDIAFYLKIKRTLQNINHIIELF